MSISLRPYQAQAIEGVRDAFRAGLTTVAGVEAVLDGLEGRRPYCVASNGNLKKVDFTLGHTGLATRFAGRIFTADDRYPWAEAWSASQYMSS
mgnify:CR=1 FL=1